MSEQTKRVLAIISVVVGILGLGCAVCFAICGIVVAIAGLVCGILAVRSDSKVLAIIGIVANAISLVAAVANMAFGAYMFATGESPFQFPLAVRDAGVTDAASVGD